MKAPGWLLVGRWAEQCFIVSRLIVSDREHWGDWRWGGGDFSSVINLVYVNVKKTNPKSYEYSAVVLWSTHCIIIIII